MAISVSFNGVVYSIPETGDESWGESLTSFFSAIPQGAFQKTAGAFSLTADANFGANFGLLSKYFSTRNALPALSGLVRLNVSDVIGWRNNANSSDLALAVNALDQLTFNGTVLGVTTGVSTPTAGALMQRDSNANVQINNLIENFATTVTAAGTTTLTVASAYNQQFTGTTTQTVVLPAANTLVLGQQFVILNRSTGVLTVNANGGSLVQSIPASSQCILTVTNIGSTTGAWDSAVSVSSIAITVPTEFSISPASITTAGTFAISKATQSANAVYVGPTNGSAAAPTFRALIAGDILSESSGLLNVGIQTSVASNALTIALKQSDGSTDASASNPSKIVFRNATSTNGAYIERLVSAALSVVVPSGATLGQASNVASYLWIYSIDNAGTVELAVSSTRFDEGSIQNTTTISSSATSNAVLYSTTGRTGVAIRLIARVKYTETTAGTWASNVSEISPAITISPLDTVIAMYYSTNGQALANGGIVNFENKTKDTHNCVTTGVGTWQFKAPRAGVFSVQGNIQFGSGTPSVTISASVLKNAGGTHINSNNGTANQFTVMTFSGLVDLALGDTITVSMSNIGGGALNTDNVQISIHSV